jgi:hypothetical protein
MRMMSLQRWLGVGLVVAAAGCAQGGTTDGGPAGDAESDGSGDGTLGDGNVGDTDFVIDAPADGGTCVAKTCASLGADCGTQGDGCGGTLDCGTCSAAGESCGGGGFANRCGKPSCTAKTCTDLGAECGSAGDGCGNVIACGTCPSGQTCGGGGASKCGTGDAGTCVAKTCASLGANCGTQSDGCGGTINCGTCTAPQTCGGGGTSSQCGGGCKPTVTTCPANACGPISDGCGGVVTCPVCPSGQACGIVTPSTCSPLPTGDGGTTCTGLCTQIPVCAAGTTTTITGKVYAPNGVDPLYNAVVWIPKDATSPLPTLTSGATCDQCGSATFTPLVSTVTAPDGTFTLSNVPAGTNIPLVVQLGKWRRKTTVTINPCTGNALTAASTRLPKNKAEGDIPKIAVVSGAVDEIECVFRKIGLDDAEFTNSAGAGRINLYRSTGAFIPSAAPQGYDTSQMLMTDGARMAGYDMILLACEAAAYETFKTPAMKANVESYVNAGGKLFATHFNYAYLYNYSPFSTTAPWNVAQPFPTGSTAGANPTQLPLTAKIDQTYPKQQAFAQWLVAVGASTTKGVVSINYSRHDVDDVVTATGTPATWSYPSSRWIYSDPSTTPSVPKGTIQHFSFNTPVGLSSDKQCGRVVYSDFHVDGQPTYYSCNADTQCTNKKPTGYNLAAGTKCLCLDPTNDVSKCGCTAIGTASCNRECSMAFPNECSTTFSNQEHVLEFMLFDLASCVQNDSAPPPPPPTCTPTTCAKLGKNCGQLADGCGGILSCGTCPAGSSCGTTTPNVCGAGCTAKTCVQLGATCGLQGDGCGGSLNCGTCPAGQTCGGGGVPNTCGGFTCTKKSCTDAMANCGPVADGCGGVIDCGTCTAPQTCGGAGVPNQCGTGTCAPKTCASFGANCGQVGDGCGMTLSCGTCTAPQSCGGGGVANQCGGVM